MTTRRTLVFLAVGLGGFLEVRAEPSSDQAAEVCFQIQRSKEVNVEGPDVERTFFRLGEGRVVIGLPKGEVQATKDCLTVCPEGIEGEIRIRRSPLSPTESFVSQVLKYRDTGRKEVPHGASGIETSQPRLDPFPFNGWKGLWFSWKYKQVGREMTTTISYLNVGAGVQVEVRTVSTAKDAAKLAAITSNFIGSWYEVGLRVPR